MDSFERRVAQELERRAIDVTPASLAPTFVPRVRRRQASVFLAVIAALGLMGFALVAGIGALAPSRPFSKEGYSGAAATEGRVAASGWRAFVVDTRNDSGPAQILAFENEGTTARMVELYPVGYGPSIAVSPDGSSLYVASRVPSRGNEDMLSIIDTSTGETAAQLSLRREGDLRARVSTIGPSFSPGMAISRDGRSLYFIETDGGSPPSLFIGTVDLDTGTLLPESVPLNGCYPGIRLLMALSPNRELAVLCEASNSVTFITISDSGATAESRQVSLASTADPRTDQRGNPLNLNLVGWGAVSSSGSHIYAVTRSGQVFTINTITKELEDEGRIELPDDTWIGYGAKVAISPDNDWMYVGVANADLQPTQADQVSVTDTSTWTVQRTIMTSTPFSHLALAPGADQAYVSNAEQGTITLLDLSSGFETLAFADEGATPQIAEVPLWARASRP